MYTYNLGGKAILITGGTGSLGRKLTEKLLAGYAPRRLVLFSRDEFKQSEIASGDPDPRLRFFIGDVRDGDRLRRAMQGIDIVIHAAAMKQVPACEYNPFEAIKTNIGGSINVVDAALDAGVQRVIAISTDKAVNPVNLYGATKLVMERAVIRGNAYSGAHGPIFSCVRYGNVAGSRGSVIPFFLRQRGTGTLPVTDRRMTRFWLTLDAAANLVLDCLSKMVGWETFVPRLPNFKIVDLARAIAPRAEIREVGIRPGEKVHEVLVSVQEGRHAVQWQDRIVILPSPPAPPACTEMLAEQYRTGVPLVDGFALRSNDPTRRMTVEALREEIGKLHNPEAQAWAREGYHAHQ